MKAYGEELYGAPFSSPHTYHVQRQQIGLLLVGGGDHPQLVAISCGKDGCYLFSSLPKCKWWQEMIDIGISTSYFFFFFNMYTWYVAKDFYSRSVTALWILSACVSSTQVVHSLIKKKESFYKSLFLNVCLVIFTSSCACLVYFLKKCERKSLEHLVLVIGLKKQQQRFNLRCLTGANGLIIQETLAEATTLDTSSETYLPHYLWMETKKLFSFLPNYYLYNKYS